MLAFIIALARRPSLGSALAGRSARSLGPQIQLRAGVCCPAPCGDYRSIEVGKLVCLAGHGTKSSSLMLRANLRALPSCVIIRLRPKLNHVSP